jgi:ubiquinone/menaquinone biosynthesis C-methylase UbiE
MIHDAQRWDAVHKRIYKEDEWHSVYAEEKEKLFPRGSVILDLGGGTGADALFFLRQGHSVVLLDISEFALKVAQEKAKRSDLIDRLVVKQVDFGLHDLPIKDNSVDAVFSRIGLNYFPGDRTVKIFHEVFRALKPQAGTAYITLKSPDDLDEYDYLQKTAVEYEPNVFIQNGQLRSRFTKEQLENLLKTAGVTTFSIKPYEEILSSDKKKQHQAKLILNEVVFSKVTNS